MGRLAGRDRLRQRPNFKVLGNVVHDNGGEGLAMYLGKGGAVVRGNTVYDNWSVNIYLDNQPNGTIERNFVFSHEPDPGQLRNNGDKDPRDNKCLKRLRPVGIMTADEIYPGTSPPANLRNVLIANNVIVNCRFGIAHYGQAEGSGLKGVRVLNNTIVVPDVRSPPDVTAGISLAYNRGNNSGAVCKNNIVYATSPDTYLLHGGTAEGADNNFKGLAIADNLWYHAGRSDPFHWGPNNEPRYDYSHARWLALPGSPHGEGDVRADPRLVDPKGLTAAGKRPRDVTSPAVGAGASLAEVAVDFAAAPRPLGKAYDIGAFQVSRGSESPGPQGNEEPARK